MLKDYEDCINILLKEEGVYSKDPNDTGGETFFGISRNNFPMWDGWAIVDVLKKEPNFLTTVKNNTLLMGKVRSFYKTTFWDKFDLDKVNTKTLCYEILEQSVNIGTSKTTEFIQTTLNALNYKGIYGTDLVVDGRIGNNTRTRLVDVSNSSNTLAEAIMYGINTLQGAHYLKLANSNNPKSDYKKYIKGWLINRVKIVSTF